MTDQLALDLVAPADVKDVERVLAIIGRRVGRANAISMHYIARQVEIGTRDVQAIVKFLVEERQQPIGTATSKPFGYYMIESQDELRENYQHFVRRGVSNLKHARAYNQASIVGPIVGQLEIEAGDKR